jgi:hypothetical protein
VAPAIYDKGTHYVTHMRLTLQILKKLNDFEHVLEIMGDYTGTDASIGPRHELGGWRKRYQDDSRPKNHFGMVSRPDVKNLCTNEYSVIIPNPYLEKALLRLTSGRESGIR